VSPSFLSSSLPLYRPDARATSPLDAYDGACCDGNRATGEGATEHNREGERMGKAMVINFFDLVESKTGESANAIRNLDPEDFHVPVSDSQGHSDRVQFRCMKQIKAMVNEVIQSKQFPYRTDSDLYRHAIVRHLHFLTDLGYLGSNTIFEIEAIMDVERDDELKQGFIASIEKLQDIINYHTRKGDKDSVADMVESVRKRIDQMPDGRWKRRYQEEMEKRYGDGK